MQCLSDIHLVPTDSCQGNAENNTLVCKLKCEVY